MDLKPVKGFVSSLWYWQVMEPKEVEPTGALEGVTGSSHIHIFLLPDQAGASNFATPTCCGARTMKSPLLWSATGPKQQSPWGTD